MEWLVIGYIGLILLTVVTILNRKYVAFYPYVKTVTSTTFLVAALIHHPAFFWVTGVVFCYFLGDVLLACANRGQKKLLFFAGMLSFAFGHILFIGYWMDSASQLILLIGCSLILSAFLIKVILRLNLNLKAMVLPVQGYLIILLTLFLLSFIQMPRFYTIIVILFFSSDIFLVFWYFKPGVHRWVKVINVILYFSAVGLLAFLG